MQIMPLIQKQHFFDLILSIGNNDTVSTKKYTILKRDDFDIVDFPFLDGDVLGVLPMVYIHLSLFALPEHLRMFNSDFNSSNKFLTANILSKDIGIINSAKLFPNFELIMSV